ncbi:MAG: hypothetical protein JXQ90_20500 [Cyclobacteriaceae bacterium]
MKRTLLLALGLIITGIAFGQEAKKLLTEDEVPNELLKKHFKLYPGSDMPAWCEEDGLIKADFRFQETNVVVFYAEHNAVKEVIGLSDIPATVERYLTKKLNIKEVESFNLVLDHKEETTYYLAMAEKDVDIRFNSDLEPESRLD